MKSVILLALLLFCNYPSDSLCVKKIEPPEYPGVAWYAQIQGEVEVEIKIDARGKVIKAVAKTGHELLRRETINNITSWEFNHFEKDQKFPITHTVRYLFKLRGSPTHTPKRPKIYFTLPSKVEIVAEYIKPDHIP